MSKLKDVSETEITLDYYDDFKSLHDRVFPNTYYSGREILDRLNEHGKVSSVYVNLKVGHHFS